MAINRYVKAPDWEPWTLPYDMILKAADMTQQRWDKATAGADEIGQSLFKDVTPIAGSVDEREVLPQIYEQYKSLRDQLTQDPDMNPTKFTYAISDFVTKNKPVIDRIKDLYTKHTAVQTQKIQNLNDPKFTDEFSYLRGYDPSVIDSRNKQVDWENYIQEMSARNYIPFITQTYAPFRTPQGQTQGISLDANGVEHKITGYGIKDLERDVNSTYNSYMMSGNFNAWSNYGQSPDMVPDQQIRAATGKSYFGDRPWAELSQEERSKAFLFLAGIPNLNINEDYSGKPSTKKAGATGGPEGGLLSEPYLRVLNSKELSGSDINLMFTGDKAEREIQMLIPKGTYAALGVNLDNSAEGALNGARVGMIDDFIDKTGIRQMYNQMLTALNQGELSYNAWAEGNEAALNKKLQELNNSPEFLKLVEDLYISGARTPDGGVPKTVADVISISDRLKFEATQDAKKKGITEEADIRKAISEAFPEDMMGNIQFPANAKVTDLGSTKVVEGYQMIGNGHSANLFLDAISDRLIDRGWWDNTTYSTDSDLDQIEEYYAKYPNLFIRVPKLSKDKDGNTITEMHYGIRVQVPLNLYDIKKQANYNRADLGQSKEASQQVSAFTDLAPGTFLQDRELRAEQLYRDMQSSRPEDFRVFITMYNNALNNMPKDIQEALRPIIVGTKNGDPSGVNAQDFSTVTSMLNMFGTDYNSIRKYIQQVNEYEDSSAQGK